MADVRYKALGALATLVVYEPGFVVEVRDDLEGTLERYGFVLEDEELAEIRAELDRLANANDEEFVEEIQLLRGERKHCILKTGERVHVDKAPRRERVGRVFAFLDELVGALPVPPGHQELLQVHVDISREAVEISPELAAVQLPLLVHSAITGEERPALPVAGACTLLFLGADLFDSMFDHELESPWHAYDPAEVNLAAATLLAALPQLSIARLQEQGTPPARLWALTHLFADTLLTMSAGQHEDLLFPDLENVSLQDNLAMVERKTGSESALFARAGAVLVTEDPSTIESYAAFGRCFGVAKQLINDLSDIWGEDSSRDLLNGKRTLPIVHALSTLRGEERERLRKLLAGARESEEYHDEVRALLVAAGSVRYTALHIWLCQQRARGYLVDASPQGSAARELWMLLDQASVLPQPGGAQPANRQT